MPDVTSLRGARWLLADGGATPGEAPGADPLQQLLAARGWDRAALDAPPLGDPLLLPDMAVAVARLQRAAVSRERVLVSGDYDADGLAATALTVRALREIGVAAEPFVPRRLEHGYGLSVEAIAAAGTPLVVAVDNGTTACAEAAWCAAHGVDLIILDHHQPGPERPNALAVVNPQLPGSRYPCRDLCGAAVAWRLACALGRDPAEDIDVVAMATVADVVPLLGENRTIVRDGLELLNKGEGRRGLRALLPTGTCTARDLAFRVAPRLNAPGRMGDASPALDLLLADGAATVADALAAIELATVARRQAADQVATALGAAPADPFIFSCGEDWHVGVLGLVAARACEEAGKPVFLLGRAGSAWRGSVRAPAGWDVTSWLAACADQLARFGGHAGAAGFECQDPEALAQALRLHAPAMAAGPAPWRLDGVLGPDDLTLETADALAALEPHGEGNPPPRFLLPGAAARRVRTVGQGGRHLKLTLNGLDAIAFDLGFAAPGMAEGSRWDACLRPRVDTYAGRVRLQLDVEDLRPADGSWQAFLAAYPDRAPLVDAYRGLRAMAARGPLPPLPALPVALSAHASLPLPTARAAAAIFAELGLLAGPELVAKPVELAASPSYRLAAQVRERCRAIIR